MSQNATSFALNFATLFQCAIKPQKSKSQRESVNALLIQPGIMDISNAASSNYTTGKRVVPDDYRTKLASLSEEELVERLSFIGIIEYDKMCMALLRLVECAKIPPSQRKRLIDTYHNSTQMDFIKKTIHAAADCKEAKQLSDAEIKHLAGFSAVESTDNEHITEKRTETAADNASRYSLLMHKTEDKHDHSWISDYASPNADTEDIGNRDFFCLPVAAIHQVLNMPYDFPKLLSLLTPMVKGDPIDEFTIEDFMKKMSIGENKEITKGSIECLTLIGQVKSIAGFISKHDLSEVSDIAFLMAGKVTNPGAAEIKNAIITATNENVNCLQAMWFDHEIPELEVTLIMHVCKEEADIQSSYNVDPEGVKVPKTHNG